MSESGRPIAGIPEPQPITIDTSGRVNGFSLRNGGHKIYHVWLRHVEY